MDLNEIEGEKFLSYMVLTTCQYQTLQIVVDVGHCKQAREVLPFFFPKPLTKRTGLEKSNIVFNALFDFFLITGGDSGFPLVDGFFLDAGCFLVVATGDVSCCRKEEDKGIAGAFSYRDKHEASAMMLARVA